MGISVNQRYKKKNKLIASEHMEWIDIAKAVAICLVVIGHFLYDGTDLYSKIINKAIYSFHVPLFFIVSGYLSEKKEKTKGWLTTRAKRVLVPAILWNAIFEFFRVVVFKGDVRWVEFFYLKGELAYNDPVWFFFCLFEIEIFSVLLYKYDKNSKQAKIIEALACFIVGFILFKIPIIDFLGLKKAIICFGFYKIGELIRNSYFNKNYRIAICQIICSIVPWILFGLKYNEKISIYKISLGRYWCFVFAGIFGSILFLSICYLISCKYTCLFFREIKQNSVCIICSHYCFISFYLLIMNYFSWKCTIVYDVIVIPYLVLMFWIYIKILNPFVRKHVPVLNGMW